MDEYVKTTTVTLSFDAEAGVYASKSMAPNVPDGYKAVLAVYQEINGTGASLCIPLKCRLENGNVAVATRNTGTTKASINFSAAVICIRNY